MKTHQAILAGVAVVLLGAFVIDLCSKWTPLPNSPSQTSQKPWEATPEQLAKLSPAESRAFARLAPLMKRWDALVQQHGSDARSVKPDVLEEYRKIAEEAWQIYHDEPVQPALRIAGQCSCNYIQVLYFTGKREDALKELVALEGKNPREWPVRDFLRDLIVEINNKFWSTADVALEPEQEEEYRFIIDQAEQISKTNGDSRLKSFSYNARIEYSKVLFASNRTADAVDQLKQSLEGSPRNVDSWGFLKLTCKYEAMKDQDFAQAFAEAGGAPESDEMTEAAEFVKTANLGPGERFAKYSLVEKSSYR